MPQAAEAPGDPKAEGTTYRGLTAPALSGVLPDRPTPPRLGRFRIRLSRAARLPVVRIAALFMAPLVAFFLIYSRWTGRVLLPTAPGTDPVVPLSSLLSWVVLLGSGQVLSAQAFGLFHPLGQITLRRLVVRVWLTSALGCAVILLTEFLGHRMPVSKAHLPIFYGVNCGALVLCFLTLQRLERRRPERVLLLGPWKETDNFLRALQTLPSRKRVVFPSPDLGFLSGRVGPADDFRELFSHQRIDRVYLVKDAFSDEQVLRLLEAKPPHVSLYVVPSTWDSMISRLALGPVVGDLRLFEIRTPLADPMERFLKRTIDFCLSLLLLILALPLQLGIALAVLLTEGGPVLYRQRRVGRHGQEFEILKFRTMICDAEAGEPPGLVGDIDPRVTPLGCYLRRFRLDELPQLWNVLRGDMALVGPRPERPCFVEPFIAELPGYSLRHEVRPGITGIAQVYGKYQSHPREKLRFDLAYIFNYSPMLDLTILMKTAWLTLLGLIR